MSRAFTRQRQADKDKKSKRKLQKALGSFRPRKTERGKIVFIGRDGRRTAAKGGRVGYAVYVNRKGVKVPVRQHDRTTGRVEKVPRPRKLADTDVSRVRSKKAKQSFLESHTTEISRGQTIETSRYGFRRNFRRIDAESEFAEFAAKELLKILRGIRSTDRNLALEIGIWAKTPNGVEWFQTQLDALPGDLRKGKIENISIERLKAFFGRQIYSFIARELSSRGYVMAGSANFVRKLSENRGKARDRWTKQGHIWQGADKTEITVQSVEWRFLQLTFTNR